MTTTTTSTKNKKTYKWADNSQKAATSNSDRNAHRVQKRTTSRNTRTRSVSNAVSAIMATVADEMNKQQQQQQQQQNPYTEIEQLQNDLSFTYDTIATITVHYDSLYHAYISSKPELDRYKNATRLCEMEKELLTAYDDLGLQVNHLERKIAKYEKRLAQLRHATKLCIVNTAVADVKDTDNLIPMMAASSEQHLSSSFKGTDSPSLPQPQQQHAWPFDCDQTPFLHSDNLNYGSIISSPCSSTDTLMAEIKVESPDSIYHNYNSNCDGREQNNMSQLANVIIAQDVHLYNSDSWYLSKNDNYGLYSDTNNNKSNNMFVPQPLQPHSFHQYIQQQGMQLFDSNSPHFEYNDYSNEVMYNDMNSLNICYYPIPSQY